MTRMTKREIRQCVIDALHQVLGESATHAIDDRTNPVDGLGLDSPAGIEYGCELSARLEYEIPLEDNPFYEGVRTRSVSEIVDYVSRLMADEEGKRDV